MQNATSFADLFFQLRVIRVKIDLTCWVLLHKPQQQLDGLELWGEEDRLQSERYPISNHFMHQLEAARQSWVLSNWQTEAEQEAQESDWASAVNTSMTWAFRGWRFDSHCCQLYNIYMPSLWLELREDESLPRLIIAIFSLILTPNLSWLSQCLCEWICSHMRREKQQRWCCVVWEHQGGNVGQRLPVLPFSLSHTHTSDTYTSEAKLHWLYW